MPLFNVRRSWVAEFETEEQFEAEDADAALKDAQGALEDDQRLPVVLRITYGAGSLRDSVRVHRVEVSTYTPQAAP